MEEFDPINWNAAIVVIAIAACVITYYITEYLITKAKIEATKDKDKNA